MTKASGGTSYRVSESSIACVTSGWGPVIQGSPLGSGFQLVICATAIFATTITHIVEMMRLFMVK